MEDYNGSERDEVFSKRIKAGKRTYFIDVKTTKGNDYYITITESKRKPNGHGYTKHKIFLYKEDFNKFSEGLTEVVNHIKTDLMPEYDFEQFDHSGEYTNGSSSSIDIDALDPIHALEEHVDTNKLNQ